ncbi:MAG: DedA family protein [Candidatus Brocadiia bacterium]
MDFIKNGIDFVLHVDKYLSVIIQNFGVWSYGLLALIIFSETGFVVTPFLPGDSLLFAAGAFAATGSFNSWWLFLLLTAAAIIGNTVNYAVGRLFGQRLFKDDKSRIFRKEYLDRTHRFYEKHGRKTIILTRFVPIVRTFAPFVAGMGKMGYLYFFTANVIGAVLWVGLFIGAGYYFGNVPFVKNNFSLVILAIIIISVLPVAIEFWRHRSKPDKGKV